MLRTWTLDTIAPPFLLKFLLRGTSVDRIRATATVNVSPSMSGSKLADFVIALPPLAWIIANATCLAALPTGIDTARHSHIRGRSGSGHPPGSRTETRVGILQPRQNNWEAIDALDGAGAVPPGNTRLLVIISDVRFSAQPRAKAQKRLARLRANGCAVLWLAPRESRPVDRRDRAHIVTEPATAHEIGRTATAAVHTV
ncbi:hypothetical protein AB4305_14860 [Nocardia sp. 2YAB30]|uniref:hypothetical protein n=1 Tax=unclassified Nocardia TaxID=2637762 RepID=UPI003F9C06A0